MQAADTEDKSDTESALIAFTVCKGRLDMDRKCKWHQRCPVRFKKGLLPQQRQGKLPEKMAFRRYWRQGGIYPQEKMDEH